VLQSLKPASPSPAPLHCITGTPLTDSIASELLRQLPPAFVHLD
jgi:hypothetical protein